MSKPSGGVRTAKQTSASSGSGDALVFNRQVAKWKGYVNVEQSDATRSQYLAWSMDTDLVQETLASLSGAGYKVTVVCDGSVDVYKATAYAAFRGMPDEGLAVSAWSGSFWDAVCAVTFIVAIQSQLNLSPWWTEGPSNKRFTF